MVVTSTAFTVSLHVCTKARAIIGSNPAAVLSHEACAVACTTVLCTTVQGPGQGLFGFVIEGHYPIRLKLWGHQEQAAGLLAYQGACPALWLWLSRGDAMVRRPGGKDSQQPFLQLTMSISQPALGTCAARQVCTPLRICIRHAACGGRAARSRRSTGARTPPRQVPCPTTGWPLWSAVKITRTHTFEHTAAP